MPLWLLVLKLTNFKVTRICEQELELSALPEHCTLSKQFHGNSTGLSIFCAQLFVHAIMLRPLILGPVECAASVNWS